MFSGDPYGSGMFGEGVFAYSMFSNLLKVLHEKNWEVHCVHCDESGSEVHYTLVVPENCRDYHKWMFVAGNMGFILKSRLSRTEKSCMRISLEVRLGEINPGVRGHLVWINKQKQKLDHLGNPTDDEARWNHTIRADYFVNTMTPAAAAVYATPPIPQSHTSLLNVSMHGVIQFLSAMFGLIGLEEFFAHYLNTNPAAANFIQEMMGKAGSGSEVFVPCPAIKFLLAAFLKLSRNRAVAIGLAVLDSNEPTFAELAEMHNTAEFPAFAEAVAGWCSALDKLSSLICARETLSVAVLHSWIRHRPNNIIDFVVWVVANIHLIHQRRPGNYSNVAGALTFSPWDPFAKIFVSMLLRDMFAAAVNNVNMMQTAQTAATHPAAYYVHGHVEQHYSY